MGKTLVIFVDGISADFSEKYVKFLGGTKVHAVTPGIGFSNNLYPEMLVGKNPDEIGYFNEWSPTPTPKKLPFYFRILDMFRPFLYINAGIRKIILRKIFRKDYANIPFRYAGFFKPQGSHDFADLGDDSLLAKYDFIIYDSVDVRGGALGQRDKEKISELTEKLENRNTFLSLVDLDNIQHVHGVTSKESTGHVEYLNESLTPIVDKFLSFDDGNQVMFFSDHGMVDVDRYIDFDLESSFGKMKKGEYLYFLDSTYLRVWVENKEITEKMKEFLETRPFGELLSEEERTEFGISNRDFGDFIFRAKESEMFLPNFYGARKVKAMHGYDSSLVSQQASFAHVCGREIDPPKNSKGIYNYFASNFSN